MLKHAMALKPGTRVGSYEIIAPLGAGGMGEVYRATDTKLKRDVAIKVLPDDVAGDRKRLARFEREAHVLASLNHPHIASIYGLEEFGGVPCLVLELVEGQTLAERLAAGPLPVKRALEVAKQIASALEAAHEKGIIHRDLKPANVKITPERSVKVLDFGLAKALAEESAEMTGDPSHSPTLPEATQAGAIMGTAAYMSPEQARGKRVDKTTDIWAFGCVLFEMLTGRHPFEGETRSDTLARVLEREPKLDTLPAKLPATLRRLLRRCLTKDVSSRLQAIGDARVFIQEYLADPLGTAEPEAAVVSPWRRFLPWGLVGLLAAAVVLVSLVRWPKTDTGPHVSSRLSINLPPETPLAPAAAMPLGVGRRSLALSPDGGWLAVVLFTNGETRLHLREMASGEMHPLPGTKGAHSPFFSPDGNWVGFFADDKLKKIPVSRAEPMILCAATEGFGGSWGADGTIYFSADQGERLYKVSASGGGSQALDSPGKPKFPQILPGGRALLLTAGSDVAIQNLETGESKVLQERGTFAHYSLTGHIVFAWRGRVFAAAFDLDRLEFTGPSIAVLDGVRWERQGAAQFTFANDGTLVFSPGGDATIGRLVWIDQEGVTEPLGAPPGDFSAFSIAPDGKRVAVPILDETGRDIWIYDIERGTPSRFTSDGISSSPIWTRDGNVIFYSTRRDGAWRLYRKAVGGREEAEQVTTKHPVRHKSLTQDDKFLVFTTREPQAKADIWLLPLQDDGSVAATAGQERAFLRTPHEEYFPTISPDGRWLAYTSDETGGWEVYVRSFPDAGRKLRISTQGGEEPVWSPDGSDLYYRFGSQWFAVSVTLGERFTAGRPRLMFDGPYINLAGWSYDVSPLDGRFLVVESAEQTKTISELTVITNWLDELKRKADAEQ
jgi:serine/threonine-protein kinase